jgi:hypothetical protein
MNPGHRITLPETAHDLQMLFSMFNGKNFNRFWIRDLLCYLISSTMRNNPES